ncbi:MAG: glycosyltransferase [Gammaproteobacteria bacterium]|nr:glycosyltransferase [Gammaproteobacteria bacterium]
MRDAYVYDFLLANGGAEQLAITLTEAILDLELHAGFVNYKLFPDNLAHVLTKPVFHPVHQAILMMYLFRNRTAYLQHYRHVIFSGSYAPLAIRNRTSGRNIYYCHTPPRFVYDLQDYYLQQLPFWQKPLLKALISYVRLYYEPAIRKMDTIIANSQNVRQRLLRYLDIQSDVVYPPVQTECFKWQSSGRYYLSTARLEPYKRVDLIIKAFLELPDKQLIVASGGSDLTRLKQLAGDAENIRFTGWMSEQQLQELVGNAIATLYLPIDEDFGMSPVESMAAGKPVIGAAQGGLLETVINGETGILLETVDVDSIKQAIECMTPSRCLRYREPCEQQAQQFTVRRFISQMGNYLQ